MYLLPYFLALLSGVALFLIAPEIPFLTSLLTPFGLVIIVLFAVVIIIHALLLLFGRPNSNLR
ncbi:hypothetical protein [Pueribacillus sp. YX66]|uniref:hypothetical protein n=1 Tax=Pueribacillus sp. YX66 TaxID=3229242 RepID=UPI00358D4645